jgi:hypothetical protein
LDLNGELAGWLQDEFESEDDEDEVLTMSLTIKLAIPYRMLLA